MISMLNRSRRRLGGVHTDRGFVSVAIVAWIVAVIVLQAAPGQREAPASARPKLVVLMVVDQLRAGYLGEYGGGWTGGLHRLMRDGAWFTRAEVEASWAWPRAESPEPRLEAGGWGARHITRASQWETRPADRHAAAVPW